MNYRVKIKKYNPAIKSPYYWVKLKVYRPGAFWPFWSFNDTVLEETEKEAFEKAARKGEKIVQNHIERRWEREQRKNAPKAPKVKPPKFNINYDKNGVRIP